MKTNIISVILFAGMLLASACSKGPEEPPKEEPGLCKYKGKFEQAICGWGVYGNYWIRLDDGTFLQPCKSDVALIDVNTIYEGMPVEVDYEVLQANDPGCESPLTCLAWPGEHTKVKLTCLKTLCGDTPRDNECNVQGMLYDWRGKLDGCTWMVQLNSGQMLELPPGSIDDTKFDDNTPVLINYKEVQRGSDCMAGTTVELYCIKVANTTGGVK